MKKEFDVTKYNRAIVKNRLIILIVGIASFIIAMILNFEVKDNKYRAYANVYSKGIYNNIDMKKGTYVLQNYAEIITSKRVADRAALIIGEDTIDGIDIKSMISYSYSEDSPVYKIYATSKEPQLAITVANAVAKAFVTELNNIVGEDSAQILDEAYEYENVFNGRQIQIRNIIVITLCGVLFSLIVIIAVAFFSTKIESVNDATINGEIEILGVIPNFDVE